MNIVLYESGESRLALASAPKTASLQAMLAEERAALGPGEHKILRAAQLEAAQRTRAARALVC